MKVHKHRDLIILISKLLNFFNWTSIRWTICSEEVLRLDHFIKSPS